MKRRRGLFLPWCPLIFGAFVACASSPEPRFYSLTSVKGAELGSEPLRVEVRRPSIVGYLDRPNLVRRTSPVTLDLAANEQWGAPLQELVGNALTEDLVQRLPRMTVYPEGSSLSSDSDVIVAVQVLRFELSAGGDVTLIAQVAIQRTDGTETMRRRHEFHSPPTSLQAEDVAQQMSAVLAKLSDEIAEDVQKAAEVAERPARQE